MGVVWTTFLVWSGRSKSVADYFLEADHPRLSTTDAASTFIWVHEQPCGDGKTADSRFFVSEGPGQNAVCVARILNTFSGPKLQLLLQVVEANSVEEAFQAMLGLQDFGVNDSTRFVIKKMLAPLGAADVHMKQPLFAWSHE